MENEIISQALLNMRQVIEQLIEAKSELLKIDRIPTGCDFLYLDIDKQVFGEEVNIALYEKGWYSVSIKSCHDPECGNETFSARYNEYLLGNEAEKVAEIDRQIKELREKKKELLKEAAKKTSGQNA